MNVTSADFAGRRLNESFCMQVFTAPALCNTLKALQIIGAISYIAFNLPIICKNKELIMKISNCSQTGIESGLLLS